MEEYDVLVVGAGHAGVEAALASARMGCKTCVATLRLDAIANMPCNPSIGGTGKGHLVFEIDALGGEMGYQADRAMIQSRTLNTGKGAAVRSKRIQADRRLYSSNMKHCLETTENVYIRQAQVVKLIYKQSGEKKVVTGAILSPGGEISVKAVVLCTGTYPDGITHIGEIHTRSGPDGMLGSVSLSEMIGSDSGVRLMRFKTGTPQRILKSSIDLDDLDVQNGEEYITPFSRRTDPDELNKVAQKPCHIVYTNETTHSIIRANLSRSPMYSGVIKGVGPRYCPSIEDKVVRFPDKERHQLFIEPMGLNTEEMYLQGFSSSMPDDVQLQMVHSLKGFENAQIMRFAYAIEYDCVDPLELTASLEFKKIGNLFGAGQTNGSSGYEEAAAQGIVAGINAALKVQGREPMILPRSSSYTGTLIDDLVTKGTNEPYRIMTSRSEFRLLLRQDNTEERISKYGHDVGLLSDERYNDFLRRKDLKYKEISRLEKLTIPPSKQLNDILVKRGSTEITTGEKCAELIRRPQICYDDLADVDAERPDYPCDLKKSIETEIKYAGYIKHEESEAKRQAKMEDRLLPDDINYLEIKGLRIEAAQKLEKIRPKSIGQASRISGVNPADITVLLIYMSSQK